MTLDVQKNFRLNAAVQPSAYMFTIRPDLQSKKFQAYGSIAFDTQEPITELIVHGVHLTVQSASIHGKNTTHITTNEVSQTVHFHFENPIPQGSHVLDLSWNGIFHDDLRGLYKAGAIGVTQFEAADARRVFPCFDEPSFKATWTLHIEAQDGLVVISNGALKESVSLGNGWIHHTFATTPKMSSYLVALVVGKLASSEVIQIGPISARSWGVPEKAHLTAFAQTCTGAVLPLLEQYFDYPYIFGKLDQIGIPDFEAGAMENSGCITYREVLLLVDPSKDALSVLKRSAEVITHELAHQWFGNLVTMKWWDDLWLNEAFATWMAYKIVDQWKPNWRMWDDFALGKAGAMGLDAMLSTHPICGPVLNADQATENFDLITYEKGGALLRMIEGFIGENAFKNGIQAYMRKHEYQNTAANDLWNALTAASGIDVGEVANAWMYAPGFPLISVSCEGNQVNLSQRQFFADPALFEKGSAQLWPTPIVLRWADDAGIHTTQFLLKNKTDTVKLNATGSIKYVVANANGEGFFRVHYSDESRALLLSHIDALTPVEQVNLIADTWSLFRANGSTLSPCLDILNVLSSSKDYTVLGEVVGRMDMLEKKACTDQTRDSFRAFVSKNISKTLATLTTESAANEGDSEKLLRAAAIRGVALVAQDSTTTASLLAQWKRFSAGDESALELNIRDLASIVAARTLKESELDALIAKFQNETNPATKRRYLNMIANVHDVNAAQRAIELSVTDLIPMQDSTMYFSGLIGNSATREKVWTFIQTNTEAVHIKTASPFMKRRLIESLGEYSHHRAAVESFFDANSEEFKMNPKAIEQTKERLALDENMQQRAKIQLQQWLSSKQ